MDRYSKKAIYTIEDRPKVSNFGLGTIPQLVDPMESIELELSLFTSKTLFN